MGPGQSWSSASPSATRPRCERCSAVTGRSPTLVIPLRRLERADAILSVLENSILPALSAAPTSAVWVKAAKRYAKRLNRQAVGAGGSFYGRAVIVVRCLRNLARDASLIPLRVSDYRLSNRAMRIRDLRSSEVSIALM